MQKTILYLLLLLILGSGAYYFVFDRKDSPFPQEEAGFRIKDTGRIGKIYLVRTDGESLLLERTAEGWLLNNRYKALNSPVSHLLGTIAKQDARAPVPEASHNSIIKTMAGSSIKVELYDRKGTKMKIFYVGSDAYNYAGTYMLIEGASKPYLVGIPGFEGSISATYNTDFDNWRDRTVFDIRPEDIQSIAVEYPEYPLNSFTIRQQGDQVAVEADPGASGTLPLNTERVRSYLTFFTNLNCEGYLNGKMSIDSILSVVPKHSTVTVTGKKGPQRLDVYWMPINKRSKNVKGSNRYVKVGYDADRYYGVMNGGADTVIIQQYNFGKVFRRAYEFYEADISGLPKN